MTKPGTGCQNIFFMLVLTPVMAGVQCFVNGTAKAVR